MDSSAPDIDLLEFEESQLSESVVVRPQGETAAQSLSQEIVYALKNHKDAITSLLTQPQSKDFEELRKTLYKQCALGHLPDAKDRVEEVLNDIEHACSDPNTPIERIIPLHAVFGYRVIKKLDAKNSNGEVYTNRYDYAYSQSEAGFKAIQFSNNIRKAIPDNEVEFSQLPGTVSKGSRFAKNTKDPHFRGRDKFIIDLSNPEAQSAILNAFGRKDIPIAAGPSAHARAELASAYALGLSHDQIKELTYLIACYKSYAGHHTLHEVIRVSAVPPFNVPYAEDQDFKRTLKDYGLVSED